MCVPVCYARTATLMMEIPLMIKFFCVSYICFDPVTYISMPNLVHLSLYYLYTLKFFVFDLKLYLFKYKCQIKPCLPRPPAESYKTTNPLIPLPLVPHFPLWFPFKS
jgi:hypothetical protein